MTNIRRLTSSVLLGLGVTLVFAGLNSALGFTPGALFTSAAVIAALIYAGAVWFAPPLPASSASSPGPFNAPVVFDRDGLVVSGTGCGKALSAQFPEALRGEVSLRCSSTFHGMPGHVVMDDGGRMLTIEFLPVRSSTGEIVYGLMVTGAPVAV